MQHADDFFTSFSYDKEIEKARWFKEDLDNGGWKEIHNSPGAAYWQKTFPENQVPIKILMKFDLPLSAESFMEMLNPQNIDLRKAWDRVFGDQEIVETYPGNQGHVFFIPVHTSWPLRDRSFMLFSPPTKEIDWFGKKAYILIQMNAWHSSKPAGADGRVRVTNGGNFFVIIPDETAPDSACTVFSLSNNNYNGWMPKRHIEGFVSRAVVSAFNRFFESVVEGYQKYFKH